MRSQLKVELVMKMKCVTEKIVMIIANNNLENKELQLSRFDEMLSGKNVGVEITSGKQILLNNPITIPTKTVYVIEIN